ncbi:hypothetical protein [Nocardia blacklockiae]|uniref:hypothetical protein n=1 Tax=Nocardia blacklockiae TaxID=480036 RepID=UPI0018947EB5|nr:hypothetical protein [Nocardia blacklockiae]MBF6172794.1 hypothetical protein [Nocardia blacklockiae]
MRITKSVATALLCLTAVTATAATAAADPERPERPPFEAQGTDHGVDYRVGLTEDKRAAVSTLQAGRFLATWDAESVAVTDDSGRYVTSVPLRYDIAGHRLDLAPLIEDGGRRLTLTPVGQAPNPVRDIDAQQRLFDVVQAHAPAVASGAAIGAVIGFFVGFPAGLFMFDIITVPIFTVLGALVGGAAGLYSAGGQSAVDEARQAVDHMVTGGAGSPR